MRNFCKAIVMVLMFITVLTGCAAPKKETIYDEQIDYDAIILDNAQMELYCNPFVEEVPYEVKFVGGRNYIVTIENEDIPIEIPENSNYSFDMTRTLITKGKVFNTLEKSKAMVKSYITASTILHDKEMLCQKITELPLYMVTSINGEFSFVPDAFYENGSINVRQDSKDSVCEWMFVHEMIHYLCEITNNGQMVYEKNDFDEAMTDIITSSMNPKLPNGEESGYLPLYNDGYKYIAIWKDEAIRAYFYGYDVIWQKVGKPEFDCFVFMFHNMSSNQLARYCVDFTYAKWYNEFLTK